MCDYVQRKFLIFSNGLLYLLTISSNLSIHMFFMVKFCLEARQSLKNVMKELHCSKNEVIH